MSLPRFACLLALSFTGSAAFAATNPALKPAETPEQFLTRAAAAEKDGQWERALESYLRAYLAGRKTPEVRERIAANHRLAAQSRRHRDPSFQQHVTALKTSEALDLYAEVLEKLSTLHADRDRSTPSKLFLSGIEEFDRALANKSFRRDHLPGSGDATVAKFRRTLAEFWKPKPPTTVREARAAALELTRAASSELGLKTGSAVVLELLCGSCHALDEYTVYLSPLHHASDKAGLVELAGYGILAAFRDGVLTVDRVLPESWAAEHVMLRTGDRIVRINGRRIADGVTLTESLRFPINGEHEIESVSDAMMMTAPVRLPSPVPTVHQTSILNSKDGIGYLKLTGFNDQTPLELDAALARLKEQGARSLILDLRGNVGGHFFAGVRVAERFVPAGIIVTTDGQSPEFAGRVFSSDSGMAAFDLPMVVLIDTKTLSAAEIVASALKEQQRAVVIGMPTFGKGVVQHPFKLAAADGPDASGIHKFRSGTLVLTIAKILTARGSPIHGNGILPDIIESDPARQLALALERLGMR